MKNQKGITLIALVVTIIVMIILASVSLNNVLGDNGIISRVNKAHLDQKAKSAQEQVMSAVASMEYYELASGDRGAQLKSLMNSNNLQKYLNGRVNGFIVNGDSTTVYYSNDEGSFTITLKYPGTPTAKAGIYVVKDNNDTSLNTVEMDEGEKVTFTSDKNRYWVIFDADNKEIVDESKAIIDVYTGEFICKEKGNYIVKGFEYSEHGVPITSETSDYVIVKIVEKEEPYKPVIVATPVAVTTESDAAEVPEITEPHDVIEEPVSESSENGATNSISPTTADSSEPLTTQSEPETIAEFEVGTNVVAKIKDDNTMYICKKEDVSGNIEWELSPKYLSNGITFDDVEGLTGVSETNIIGIIVEEGIKTIPDKSFNKFTSTTTLSLPVSLTTLGNIIPSKEEGLFKMTTLYYNCKSLTSIAMLEERARISAGEIHVPVADWPTYDIDSKEWKQGYVIEDATPWMYDLSVFTNSKVANIIFGETVESLPNSIFQYCTYIEELRLPSSLRTMGKLAFGNCINLNTLIIPEGRLTTISEEAFTNNQIRSLIIPSNVTSLGTRCFCSSRELKELNIPGTVKYVGDYAFYYSWNIEKVVINEGTIQLGSGAFGHCTHLRNINFNVTSSLKTIGSLCFNSACYIENVQLPDCVTMMYASAFYKNRHLKTLKFPKYLKNYIKVSYCEELENIIWPEVDFVIALQGFMGNNHFTELTLPDNCVGIEYNAFKDSPNLKTINFGSGIKFIETRAFWDCTALTTVNLNEGLEEIQTTAFRGCTALQQITIPSTVTSMGEDVFEGCKKISQINLLSPSTGVLNNDLKPWSLNHTQSITVKWSDGVTEKF